MQDTVNKDREKYIGGSDIPVIMNLSPFKSRFDLLLEKAGYKTSNFEGNIYTEYGNTMEPKIREFINKTHDTDFTEGKHVREAAEDEIIGVRIHTDGENDNCILEVKTTSTIHDSIDEYKIYLVQLLFYMVNTGKPYGLLAVYDRPEDLSGEFHVDRLQLFNISLENYTELCSEISDACERFIEDLAKVKDNPFITEDELLPSDITEITRRILAFEDQIKYMKDVEAQIKREKARLKSAMEAASVKSWTTPNGYKITLVPDSEDKAVEEEYLNLEQMKKDLPDLFISYDNGGYMERRTVIKKGKSGYVLITPPKKKET
jgi:predicted phage-related endonuclease